MADSRDQVKVFLQSVATLAVQAQQESDLEVMLNTLDDVQSDLYKAVNMIERLYNEEHKR